MDFIHPDDQEMVSGNYQKRLRGESVPSIYSFRARDAMPSEGKLILETENVELDGGFVRSHLGVKPGRYVRPLVTDAGCGISKEVREGEMDFIQKPFTLDGLARKVREVLDKEVRSS